MGKKTEKFEIVKGPEPYKGELRNKRKRGTKGVVTTYLGESRATQPHIRSQGEE